jgi:lipoprotein NlpI
MQVKWISQVALVLLGTLIAPMAVAQDMISQAITALERREYGKAIELAGQAITAAPKEPDGYIVRAQAQERLGKFEPALSDYDKVIELEPGRGELRQLRGGCRFRNADIKGSLEDFDKYLMDHPDQRPHHWQRGIALYYAGKFEEGQKQFEIHKTVNPHDVENATWHYLCAARRTSAAEARRLLIPIDTEEDTRVPMKQVYELYSGKGTVEQVLASAREGKPAAMKRAMFYAHLYIGLYYEAAGDATRAREHMAKAAGEFAGDDYMSDVARVHIKLVFPEKP